MRIILVSNGQMFEGKPVEVVTAMKDQPYAPAFKTAREYAEWSARTAASIGVAMDLSGADSDDEVCMMFVQQLLLHGLAKEVEPGYPSFFDELASFSPEQLAGAIVSLADSDAGCAWRVLEVDILKRRVRVVLGEGEPRWVEGTAVILPWEG